MACRAAHKKMCKEAQKDNKLAATITVTALDPGPATPATTGLGVLVAASILTDDCVKATPDCPVQVHQHCAKCGRTSPDLLLCKNCHQELYCSAICQQEARY